MNFVINDFGSRLYKRTCSLDSSLSELPSFELLPSAKLIGEGKYRQAYLQDDVVVKILKTYRNKKEGIVTISYPMGLYTQSKFGISDFNQHEFENYRRLESKLPSDLRPNFQHIKEVRLVNGLSATICDAIKDYDGKLSKDCSRNQLPLDSGFYASLDVVFDYLIQSKNHLMDFHPMNVLAQQRSAGSFIPVFFDYKRLGHVTYPLMPWLRINHFSEQRFKRRFDRMTREIRAINGELSF